VELHGSPLWLDAHYYDDRPDDDAVPSLLGEKARVDVEPLPFPFEGGAVVSNGHGLCASTTTSLARAGIDVDDAPLTDHFLAALGCRAWAVLPPLDGEDTGHVDMFVQFVSPGRALVAEVDEARSPANAARLDEAAALLERAAHLAGTALHVTRVPLWIADDGEILSWVNGARVGDRFLAPTFTSAPRDVEEQALARIAAAVAPLDVVRVPADAMAALGGAIHCTTLGLELNDGRRPPRASRSRSAWASWATPRP
jgi:agmatine/peptidylarginine deiminase